MFSQASVILFTGGGRRCTPPGRQQTPPWTPSRTHLPWTPTLPRPPPPPPPEGHCTGRYASYWNAYVIKNVHNDTLLTALAILMTRSREISCCYHFIGSQLSFFFFKRHYLQWFNKTWVIVCVVIRHQGRNVINCTCH